LGTDRLQAVSVYVVHDTERERERERVRQIVNISRQG